MDPARKRSAWSRGGFAALVVVVVFVMLHIAVAINTVDHCGEENAPKHWGFWPPENSWQLFPPEWICEDQTPDF